MSIIYSPPELIVVAKPSARMRAAPGAVSAAGGAKISGLNALLKSGKLSLQPLFGESEARVRSAMGSAPDDGLDPATFYVVQGDVKSHKKLIESLLNEPSIDGAYWKPGGEPPVYRGDEGDAPRAAPNLDQPPAPTPAYESRQIYLDASPAGIDARFAWTKPGGAGDDVRIIDLEWGWNFSHQDLLANAGGLLDGSNHTDQHHGTAVMGEIGGDRNGFGVTGIAPNARLSAISFVGNSSAGAIRKAADRLRAGDIILLEIHRAGPRHAFAARSDQLGYIGIEWWPDDWAAIQYATNKGILVVEAAGNGAENLDDAIYNTRPTGFPASWTNPFNRSNPQCGAILVGAGAPPPGTHGRNHGADRSRLDFSNYGSAVDVQGWGREVTSTGYGNLWNDSANAQYTDTFSGTSSASPIIVGALACMQGWVRAAARTLITPAKARTLLRAHGAVQQSEPGRPATQRIGRRPDLKLIHSKLFPKTIKEIKEKDFKDGLKDIKEKESGEKLILKETVKDKDVAEKNLLKDQTKDGLKETLKDNVKEVGEKQLKELDKRKDLVENIDLGLGQQQLLVQRTQAPDAASAQIDARLAALETGLLSVLQALQYGAGSHFIDPSLRPDVGAAAQDGDDGDDDDAA
ncbi:MAG: hypothetical protein RJA98_3924 [Pseudomonadota bacterium]